MPRFLPFLPYLPGPLGRLNRFGRLGRLGAGCAALLVFGAAVAPALVPTARAQTAPAQPSPAQPQCSLDARVQTAAEERHGAQPVFVGLTASGDLMEVRSTSGGNWTIVLTLKDGSSCAVASGNGWETVERPSNSLLERSHSRTRVD